MTKLFLMCWEFFKTGLFAVGGGLATIPFLTDMSNNYGWFSLEDLMTMLAVSESTPGPIGVNMATYVGFLSYGVWGGLLMTLSLIFPSVVIVLMIARVLEKFRDSETVKGIFVGLRPAVVGFILSAALSIILVTLFNIPAFKASGNFAQFFNLKQILLFIALGGLYIKKNKLHPIILIVIAAVAGIVFAF